MSDLYYVVDLRPEWTRHPYVSLWGAEHCGYYYSMADGYAGRYALADLVPGYHYKHRYGSLRALDRFPVICSICEAMGADPDREGRHRLTTPGPVIRNTGHARTWLRQHRLVLGDPSAFDKRKEAAA